jgi:hypothetical protein
MIFRQGFISNSSSSSFIIKKEYLTPDQIEHIKNHFEYAKQMKWDNEQFDSDLPENEDWCDCGWTDKDDWHTDEWFIEDTDTELKGSTDMNNFDMHTFIARLGIDNTKVEWSE